MVWRWIINRPHQTVPPAGSATNVRWKRQRLTILTNSSNTLYVQGYHDIVNEKIASAIAKLEEAGLTPEACEKFLKTYGKVIFKIDDAMFFFSFLYRFSTPTMPTCWTSSTPT